MPSLPLSVVLKLEAAGSAPPRTPLPMVVSTKAGLTLWPRPPTSVESQPPHKQPSSLTKNSWSTEEEYSCPPEAGEGGGASTGGLPLPFPLVLPCLAVPCLVPNNWSSSASQSLVPPLLLFHNGDEETQGPLKDSLQVMKVQFS